VDGRYAGEKVSRKALEGSSEEEESEEEAGNSSDNIEDDSSDDDKEDQTKTNVASDNEGYNNTKLAQCCMHNNFLSKKILLNCTQCSDK
jgi:hypothetical protein